MIIILIKQSTLQKRWKIYDENKEKVVWKIKDLPDPANECTACEACVTVCPTHIDIRKGLQLECINCLECVDACTTVMGKLGKPSLVQWSSTNTIVENKPTKLLRKTTIMYFISYYHFCSTFCYEWKKKSICF